MKEANKIVAFHVVTDKPMDVSMTADELQIVNYCHRGCIPLKNIMRLPQNEAFALAHRLAEQNQNTTAFYRFADFENYYPERLKTDDLLYHRFVELGGKPVEKHPLSFVLQGSDYLNEWFDHGIITTIPLIGIPSDFISFTYLENELFDERNINSKFRSKNYEQELELKQENRRLYELNQRQKELEKTISQIPPEVLQRLAEQEKEARKRKSKGWERT